MSVEIRVPPLGESIVEATIGKWLKQEGDSVNAGEALAELETDKVALEVMAEQSGVLERIAKQEGDVVNIGDTIGTIATNGDQPATSTAPAPAAAAPAPAGQPEVAPTPQHHNGAGVPPAAERQGEGSISPVARRIAEEQGIDLERVVGSGPGGRITKADVEAKIKGQNVQAPPVAPSAATPDPRPPAASVQPPAPATDGREERRRMSRRRQTIAQRLVEAQRTAAMLTTFNEVDMTAVMEVRKRRKDAFKERHGVGLGFMSFFTKAVVGALKAFPLLNAEIQDDEIVIKHYYDIGIAVGAEEGLVVPVLRDADRKTFAAIEREIGELATRAREGKLSIADLQGGTFTITNGGIFGSLMSTPILNTPQVGILGMHKIEERPVALNGQVVIRPMMYVALSYDHRIVDGSDAVRFLVRVKEFVEDPEILLLEG
jgi:2-oxoglutarate dehydrogenase E2 component (dihydrolipoamide succinyltransferase)